jgi:hypothetical protein
VDAVFWQQRIAGGFDCPAMDGSDDAELRQHVPTMPKQGQAQ